MKHKILLTPSHALVVLILCLLTFSTSCRKKASENPATKIQTEQQPGLSDSLQVLRGFLSNSLNIDVSQIIYEHAHERFIVEGDMAVHRSDLENEMKAHSTEIKKLSSVKTTVKNKTSQRSIATVSSSYSTSIRVKNNCVNSAWQAATSAAINNYNLPSLTSISKVRFVEVTSGAYDIEVKEVGYTNSDPTIYAEGRLPYTLPGNSNKRPGSFVHIFDNHGSATQAKKILVITHELGHTIGLMHTNTTDGTAVNGTPEYSDPYSYMNSPILPNNSVNNSFEGFSNYDLIALSTMYPKTPLSWTQVSGTAKNLAFGDYQYVYATGLYPNSSGDYPLKRYNPTSNLWSSIPGLGVKIAVVSPSLYYYITNDKKIYQSTSASPAPIQLPGEAIDIAANAAGELYIVSTTYNDIEGNKIMKWNGSNWVQFSSRGAKKIAVGPGPNGRVWRITNLLEVEYYEQTLGFWSGACTVQAQEIAVSTTVLSPTGANIVFIVSNTPGSPTAGNNTLKRWTGVDWYTLPSAAGSSIAVDDSGRPLHTNTLGEIYWHSEY